MVAVNIYLCKRVGNKRHWPEGKKRAKNFVLMGCAYVVAGGNGCSGSSIGGGGSGNDDHERERAVAYCL